MLTAGGSIGAVHGRLDRDVIVSERAADIELPAVEHESLPR